MKSLERYINWSKLGAEVSGWHLVRVDAEGEPDRYLSWIEKNLAGAWTYHSLSDADFERICGQPSHGKLLVEFAFLEEADAELFERMLDDPARSA